MIEFCLELMIDCQLRYSPYGQDRLGMSYEVLVTETSHDGRFYVGHNEFYEQVLVPKDPNLMGKLVRVEILDTCKFSMTGRLIVGPAAKSPGLASPMDQGQVSGMTAKVAKSIQVRKILFITEFGSVESTNVLIF